MNEKMTEFDKRRIDKMSYYELLQHHRYSQGGTPLHCGETGEYFAKVMSAKREEVGPTEHTRISKKIGWD